MRPIDADEAKEALRNRISESIDECIDNVPTVDVLGKYGKWIPVNEKLPNLDDYSGSKVWQRKVLIKGYLSFDHTKELFISDAFAKDVIYNSIPYTVIIAWMPLPKL